MKRFEMRGFISISRSDLRVRGGTNYDWNTIKKFFDLISSVIDAFNTYKKDFLKGFSSGRKGENLGLIS